MFVQTLISNFEYLMVQNSPIRTSTPRSTTWTRIVFAKYLQDQHVDKTKQSILLCQAKQNKNKTKPVSKPSNLVRNLLRGREKLGGKYVWKLHFSQFLSSWSPNHPISSRTPHHMAPFPVNTNHDLPLQFFFLQIFGLKYRISNARVAAFNHFD